MKGKGVNPSYNAQAAIDTGSRMVVGGYVTNACCDSSELIPVLDDVKSHTGRTPTLVSADRGYTKLDALTELETRSIDGFISQRKRRKLVFLYDAEKQTCTCPEGRALTRTEKGATHSRFAIIDCDDCNRKPSCWRKGATKRTVLISHHEEVAIRMDKKVQSERGKEISVLRASTIEPLFGTLKFAKRLRQFTVRGLQRVSEAWQLELASYNIEKLCKVRMAT